MISTFWQQHRHTYLEFARRIRPDGIDKELFAVQRPTCPPPRLLPFHTICHPGTRHRHSAIRHHLAGNRYRITIGIVCFRSGNAYLKRRSDIFFHLKERPHPFSHDRVSSIQSFLWKRKLGRSHAVFIRHHLSLSDIVVVGIEQSQAHFPVRIDGCLRAFCQSVGEDRDAHCLSRTIYAAVGKQPFAVGGISCLVFCHEIVPQGGVC